MAPNTSSEIVGLFSGKTKDKSGASYVALRLRDIATRRLRKCTSLRALLLHPAWPAVLSCLLYSFCSISMVIVNKLILTTYEFKYPMVLMLHQNIMSIGLLRFAKWAKWVDFEPMVASKVKVWLPLNFFFVAMLLSGFYSIHLLSVPMVTIFKNSTNMLVTFGDWFLYGQHVSAGTVVTMVMMVLAAVMAGLNDLSFNLLGYLWMGLNCLSSVAYVLYMKKASQATQLSSFGKVYYNNVLSLPLILVGDTSVFHDLSRVWADLWTSGGDPDAVIRSLVFDNGFVVLFICAGMIGFLLSMTSFACVHKTSPTTYAMVGSLNKIPLSLIGLALFKTTISYRGGVFIATSLCAGVLYAYTKAAEIRRSVGTPSNQTTSRSAPTLPLHAAK